MKEHTLGFKLWVVMMAFIPWIEAYLLQFGLGDQFRESMKLIEPLWFMFSPFYIMLFIYVVIHETKMLYES